MRQRSLLSGRGSSSAPCIFTCRFSSHCFSPLAPGCFTSPTAFSMDYANLSPGFFGNATIFTLAIGPLSYGQPRVWPCSWLGLSSPTCALRHSATTRISQSLLCFIFSRFIAARPGCLRNLLWPSCLPPLLVAPQRRRRFRERATGARHHLLCPALLDQLCRHREMGGRRSPLHNPLGQPALTADRNHDCSIFAGRGSACAFPGPGGGLSGGYGQ